MDGDSYYEICKKNCMGNTLRMCCFLSAGRTEENEIRFQMYEKVPGDTSYGLTLYEQMIGKIN